MIERSIVSKGTSSPCLEPKQAVLLVVLGAIHMGDGSLKEIIKAAKHVATHDWHPTGDVIVGSVRQAMTAGLIRPIFDNDPAEPSHFEITEAGSVKLCDLLHSTAPMPKPSWAQLTPTRP